MLKPVVKSLSSTEKLPLELGILNSIEVDGI
jgi:hypothetical protein